MSNNETIYTRIKQRSAAITSAFDRHGYALADGGLRTPSGNVILLPDNLRDRLKGYVFSRVGRRPTVIRDLRLWAEAASEQSSG